jgi:hypothetical protein
MSKGGLSSEAPGGASSASLRSRGGWGAAFPGTIFQSTARLHTRAFFTAPANFKRQPSGENSVLWSKNDGDEQWLVHSTGPALTSTARSDA